MTNECSSSERKEKKARRLAVLGLSVFVGLAAYAWSGTVLEGVALGVVTMGVLELAWVMFAFEITPEYRTAQNREVARICGSTCVVVEPCSPHGRVRIDGELWQAHSADGTGIALGERVIIKGVASGLVLLVERA